MIGNQRRQPDAKVDVESIAQFAGNPLDDALAFVEVFCCRHSWHSSFDSGSVRSRKVTGRESQVVSPESLVVGEP
jgi:hypothetical protein